MIYGLGLVAIQGNWNGGQVIFGSLAGCCYAENNPEHGDEAMASRPAEPLAKSWLR